MKEIRLHGRGGQGVVTAADILATAFVMEGKYAASFPMFGFERRGAPVTAFVRFDSQPIRERPHVYNPHCLVVADSSLLHSSALFAGLREGGILVLNSPNPPQNLQGSLSRLGMVDATAIALKEIGLPATNTCIAGAFAATTGWLTLEAINSSLEEFFKGASLEKNRRCALRGFQEVKVLEMAGKASREA